MRMRVRESVSKLLHAAEHLRTGHIARDDGREIEAAQTTLELEHREAIDSLATLGVWTVVIKIDHRIASAEVSQKRRLDGVVVVEAVRRTTDRNGTARACNQVGKSIGVTVRRGKLRVSLGVMVIKR